MTRSIALLALIALVLAAAGCRSYGPPAGEKMRRLFAGHNPQRDREQLKHTSADVRRWSLISIGRHGDPNAAQAVAPLLDPATEPVPLLRATAAETLRELGNPAAVPALRNAAHDPHPTVRADAVRSLGALGDHSEIPHLARILKADPNPDVRLQAVWALRRIHAHAVRQHLVHALSDPHESVAFAAHAALIHITGHNLPPFPHHWKILLATPPKPPPK